jgi:hypothetical protein
VTILIFLLIKLQEEYFLTHGGIEKFLPFPAKKNLSEQVPVLSESILLGVSLYLLSNLFFFFFFFERLFDEQYIFGFLSVADLCKFASVCKRWNEISSCDCITLFINFYLFIFAFDNFNYINEI